jgi:hypothetical protein
MQKKAWILVSLFSVAGSVGSAAAQPGPHLAKLDTNGDGAVSAAEFEAGALARFAASDANGDGKVTADELTVARTKHAEARFAEEDANDNGVLERSEVTKMPDALFAKLDADSSQTLTKAELEQAHPGKHAKGPRGVPGDENQDGTVTKDEAVAHAKRMVKRIDANGDGVLSADELARGHGHAHRGGARGGAKEAAERTE